jgi:hypothetical protein
MYKNANASFHHTKPAQRVQQQHTIAVSRINQATKRIGTMVHVFTPPKVDEIDVTIPTNELLQDPLQSQPSRPSTSASAPGDHPLVRSGTVDMDKIQKILDKVAEAEVTSVPEWEKQQLKTEAHLNRNKKKVVGTDSTKMMLLERQLVSSIKRHHDKNATDVKHVTLSGRVLVPYYKISDITHFLEIFQIVDTNLRYLTSLRPLHLSPTTPPSPLFFLRHSPSPFLF